MVMSFADTPATKFHDLCWSMDCIQPIEHCTIAVIACQAIGFVIVVAALVFAAAAFVANDCHWSSSSMNIALASESNQRLTRRTMARAKQAIAVCCNQPVSRAIDTSLGPVDTGSYRFDAFQVALLLVWSMHRSLVAASELCSSNPCSGRATRFDATDHRIACDGLPVTVIGCLCFVAQNELD